VSEKESKRLLLITVLANVDQFSKFFQWHVPKKIAILQDLCPHCYTTVAKFKNSK